ncbi:hypothetical protein BH09MYX1_BH09MYX1_11940 [soil metagenome]
MRRLHLAGFLALVACGSSNRSGFTNDGGATNDANPFDPGQTDAALTGDGLAPPTPGCSDAAKLVYLVSSQNGLYSFNPGTLQLKSIGTLDCQVGFGVTPNSMAVDRNAKAYVNMSDGSLYTVNTANAHCTSTSYQSGQSNRRIRGMGFSSDISGGDAETLFTCTADDSTFGGGGLAKIAVGSYKLSLIGDYGGALAGTECELTGTGDARLFGFYATLSPPKLSELAKTTAKGSATTPLTVTTSSAYAFSFWGGDFWFYTADSSSSSKVTRYKYASDKSFSVVVPSTNMTVVGAGVSTCAPISPPN